MLDQEGERGIVLAPDDRGLLLDALPPGQLLVLPGDGGKGFRGWFFCLAFVSIGLESNFKELASQLVGGKPIILYIVGQSFNLALTLLMSWLAFGGILFAKFS